MPQFTGTLALTCPIYLEIEGGVVRRVLVDMGSPKATRAYDAEGHPTGDVDVEHVLQNVLAER